MKLKLLFVLILVVGMMGPGLAAGEDAEQSNGSIEEQLPGRVLTQDEAMAIFGNASWDYQIPDELQQDQIKNSITNSIENLSSQNVSVKSDAVKKLVKMGSVAVKPLIQALENDNPDIRENSALALGKIGDKRAIEPLIELIDDENWEVSHAAEIALGDIGEASILWDTEEENIGFLIAHAKNQNKTVPSRQVAVRTLGEYRQKAVSPLIQLLSDDENFLLHSDVRYALYKIGEPAVEPLIELLESDDSDVKSCAVKSLGDIGDERAIEPLGKVLNDESGQVRTLAKFTIEKIEMPNEKEISYGFYREVPDLYLEGEWGEGFDNPDTIANTSKLETVPYNAIYGKRSNFYIEDERWEYLDKLDTIGNASMIEIEKYIRPEGPVFMCGYNYEGYISVGIVADSGVNESLMNEIYDIFDQHAQDIGIENIPVVFEYRNIETNEGLTLNNSDNNESKLDNTSDRQVPGFGILSGLVCLFCRWIFRRK
ncbi:HEAT repeat domain-containing protein [Methanococcoides seepicolus]|uniref:HEAT repeat domain-containing protein n=1 Tax=Methanococcoides seepicolus TaxID=2828780 RepID=A0A9E4ZHC0_9EURY|nr:HEAT repeat domain-containing protein [Methanococcoides seepicolus]MCM1987858.1 HEAT repeat domain-containing protein [Methanococcoides seepicolus]